MTWPKKLKSRLFIILLVLPSFANAGDGKMSTILKTNPYQFSERSGENMKFRNEGNIPREINGTTVTILPEIVTKIDLSNRDINRITCMGGREVKDVIYSQEKGIVKQISGSNAYIKFLIKQEDAEKKYRVESAEIYVLCGSESTNYTMIATPKNIAAQHVQLANALDERVKQNQSLFSEVVFEKKILMIMKQGYLAEFPSSYAVTRANKKIPSGLNGVTATLSTIATVEGEGLRLKIINLEIDDGSDEIKVEEKNFIKKGMADNPVAIALDHQSVKKRRITRLFILEQPKKS